MFVRKRLPGFWIPGSVVDPLEFEYIDRDIADALDSNGGTYALAAALVLGGAGLSLSGTAHEVAAGGRLSVASTGEVRVLSGGSLTVRSGGALTVYSGGALDIAGGATIKSGGNLTTESGGSTTLASGATANHASGSTTNLNGATNIRGTTVVRSTANGGPGTISWETDATAVIQAGATLNLQGACTVGAGSVTTYSSGASIAGVIANSATIAQSGAVTNTAKTTQSGAGGRFAWRPIVTLSSSTDSDITVADGDVFAIPAVLSGNRQYTLRHTGTVPSIGERKRVFRTSQTTPSAHTAKIMREDATIIFSFYVSREGFADFEYTSGGWVVTGGAQYATSTESGYYDDVW